jgi:uncharacterized membrane protein YcaP (DUF421 family)
MLNFGVSGFFKQLRPGGFQDWADEKIAILPDNGLLSPRWAIRQ